MAVSKFGQAFASARKAGKKEFTFGGKKYNTKTKDESAAPKPKTRPKTVKESPVPKGNNPSPGGKAKTGISKGGKRGGSGITKGGNGGEKKSTVMGIGPKAKLSTDSSMKMVNYYNKKKRT